MVPTQPPDQLTWNVSKATDNWSFGTLFYADSSKMDPTKIEKYLYHFISLLPPDSSHISRTTGPTEMVHLSIFAKLNKEHHYSGMEMAVQTIFEQNWVKTGCEILYYFLFRPSLKVAIYSIWKSNLVMMIVAFKQIGGYWIAAVLKALK